MIPQLFLHTLKQHRLSATRDRKEIFTLLDNAVEPLTMQQMVRLAAPNTDRSTVYRTVNLFEKIGICARVYTGWKYRVELSDRFSSHHHHMSCSVCGNIIPFNESPAFSAELKQLELRYGFTIKNHSLELKGVCRSCSTILPSKRQLHTEPC